MRFYSNILFQLDEARRLIEDGRPEHIRLALLLLDNCAEMQMAKHIEGAFQHERIQEKLQLSYQGVVPEDDPSPYTQEIYAFKPLTIKEKRGIDRVFDDKVHYMVSRSKVLDPSLAPPLSHLHRYRNEAYHRNSTRPETIRTACLILFEINCEMLLTVPRNYISYLSGGDYSWLKERFGVERHIHAEELEKAVTSLRAVLIPAVSDVSALLADYMDDRFQAFYRQLSYISGNLPSIDAREDALAEAYSFRDSRVKFPDGEIPKAKLKPRDLQWIHDLGQAIPSIRSAASRLEAFERFAALESDFEPIETAVDEVVIEIDSYIDLQVDIMLGK